MPDEEKIETRQLAPPSLTTCFRATGGSEAVDLALLIERLPGIRFGGLMTYPSTEVTDPFAREAKTLLEEHGLPTEHVSGGGTPGRLVAPVWRQCTACSPT